MTENRHICHKPHDSVNSFKTNNTSFSFIPALCVAPEIFTGTAYVAYFITKPAYQGKGIGGTLLRRAMQRLKNHNILLHAVSGTEEMYQKYGFSRSNIGVRTITGVLNLDNLKGHTQNTKSVATCVENEKAVLDYDKATSGYDRSTFLKLCMQNNDTVGRCLLDNGLCVGYVMLRKICNGYRCHALYADSIYGARCLLYECLLHDIADISALTLFSLTASEKNVEKLLQPLGNFAEEPESEILMFTMRDISDMFKMENIYSMIAHCVSLV